MTKADEFAHPQSGANGAPVLGGVVELNEQVTAEHGLGDGLHFVVAQFLHLHGGKEAGKTLVLQVVQGPRFLAGLGVDDIPSGGGRCGHISDGAAHWTIAQRP